MNPFLTPELGRLTLPWLEEIRLAPEVLRYRPYPPMPHRPRSWGDYAPGHARRALSFDTPLRPVRPLPSSTTTPSTSSPLLRRVLSTRDAATHTTRPDTRTLGTQCTLLPEIITESEEEELLSYGPREERSTETADLDALFALCEQAAMYPRLEGKGNKLVTHYG